MGKIKRYDGQGKFFINPYNFVPAGIKCPQDKKGLEALAGTHTGVLHCEIIPKSPIAIPDTANVHFSRENAKHREYDFLRDSDGRPMIPGSSLRGSIRSMYEALTDSCLCTGDVDKLITSRTKKPFCPGLLKKTGNNWELYRAIRYVFVVEGKGYKDYNKNHDIVKHIGKEELLEKYRYGERVSFIASKERFKTHTKRKLVETDSYFATDFDKYGTAGMESTGYLCIGEEFGRKHFENIFKLQDKSDKQAVKVNVTSDILKEAVKKLDKTIDIYNDSTVNRNAGKGKKFYDGRKYTNASEDDSAFLPVWYKTEGENVYLSVANIGRFAYRNRMGDMFGARKPCKKRDALCPACRIFGMAGVDTEEALGGRIRITDALLNQPLQYQKREPLRELACPKPSYLPFYLKNNETREWSYDSESVMIRGRKFYWHNLKKNAHLELNRTKGERNTSMELIKPDMSENLHFNFDIYYENLNKRELDSLIWTVVLGENKEDSRYCYKIGHGKPIGLGSVKLVITGQEERVFNGDTLEYKIISKAGEDIGWDESLSENDEETSLIKSLQKDAVIKISDTDFCENPVAYPAVVRSDGTRCEGNQRNDYAAHQWFGYYFSLGKEPDMLLPEIGEQDAEEKALVYVMGESADSDQRYHKTEKEQGYGKQRGNNKAIIQAEKEDIIFVTATNVRENERNAGHYISSFAEGKGIVFDVPADCEGKRIRMKVTKVNGGLLGGFAGYEQ